MCSLMSSAVVRSLAGARAALEEVLVVEATPRALLRALVVREALARQLDLVASGAAEVSAVVSVVEEVAAAVLVEVTVEASEEDLAAAVAAEEVAMVVAVVALATRDRMVTVRPMALLPVLEDHEVGLVAAAVATAATVEATVVATVTAAAVTDAVEAIEDPAVLTTSRSVEIDTTTATPVEGAETAMVAATIRGNVHTRATTTTTGASAGGTRLLRKLWYVPRWVCHRLPPVSSFYLLRQRG